MMKPRFLLKDKTFLWLLLLPLLLPVVLWVLSCRQSQQEVIVDAGGFPTIETGEQAAMRKLSQVLRKAENGRSTIGVSWNSTIKLNGRAEIVLASIEFDQVHGRLVREVDLPGRKQVHSAYEGVTPDAVQQVAAMNGLARNLTSYGATFVKEKGDPTRVQIAES